MRILSEPGIGYLLTIDFSPQQENEPRAQEREYLIAVFDA